MLTMIDLFAGIGGIRIAFEQNGVQCVASSEIDTYARTTYCNNFKDEPLGDIMEINPQNLPDFDILTAGFPCQPFSVAGLRKGFEDTRGTLFFEIARFLKEKQPKAFLLENVEGIVNHKGGKTLEVIEKTLSELKYNFCWEILNASDYGIPQNRKRWYCVGFRNDLQIGFKEDKGKYKNIFIFPKKRDLKVRVKDVVKNIESQDYNITDTCKKNILKHLHNFINSKRYNKNEALIANEIRPSRCNFRCDGISPCLTAKMGTGGNNVPIYVKQMRKLTERECLDLMGFPEWYKIEKNSMHSYKQIGNSVVVSVVSELAKEIVKVLNENSTMERQVGDNAHGFQNEKNIVLELEGKKYKDLNLNMKNFIKYIVKSKGIECDNETKIKAHIEHNKHKKQDLYININNNELGVSVKMGVGNSTHQEKCEDFISYIKNEFSASDELCDDIRIMTWCDGTLDGTANISERMNTNEYLLKYKQAINKIRKFLKENERELINRALFKGRHNSRVDFIYHGTPLNGKWISAEELIDFQVKNPKPVGRSLATIGRMNLQVWNRSLKGTLDKRRGQLQVKYSSIEADLEKIMHSSVEKVGTFEGDQEEFNISRIMNRNKKSLLWKGVGHEDNKNLYVIKVNKCAYSKLVHKKVKVKTDAYIISAELSDKFLLEKEYIITENDIKDIRYNVIPQTGISVKKKDSKNFTYEKLSYNSFINLFSKYIVNAKLVFCGLTLYQNEKNIQKNKEIIENLELSIDEISAFMQEVVCIESPSIYNSENIKIFRNYCESIVRAAIENNTIIKDIIFTGKGCFDAPYYINYIYKDGKLSSDIIPERYQISNGSGRSKGNYTIIFKPL